MTCSQSARASSAANMANMANRTMRERHAGSVGASSGLGLNCTALPVAVDRPSAAFVVHFGEDTGIGQRHRQRERKADRYQAH